MVFRRRLVSLRPVVFCRSGTFHLSGSGEKFDFWIQSRQTRPQQSRIYFLEDEVLIELSYSDGIARVHGMTNVQAEELVEYVHTNVLAFLPIR